MTGCIRDVDLPRGRQQKDLMEKGSEGG